MARFEREMRPASQAFQISGKANTFVFIIISAMKPVKFHLSNTIITQVSSFGYVIYSSADSQARPPLTRSVISKPQSLAYAYRGIELLSVVPMHHER